MFRVFDVASWQGAYMGGLSVGLPNFVGVQTGYQGLAHSSVVALMEAQARMFAELANSVRHPPDAGCS